MLLIIMRVIELSFGFSKINVLAQDGLGSRH